MSYDSLKEFIDALDKENEIKYIEKEVSTHIEISKFTDIESKSKDGGKALFFKNVKNSNFPVVTNIFGSFKRIKIAFKINDINDLPKSLKSFLDFSPPKNLKEGLQALSLIFEAKKFFPKTSKKKLFKKSSISRSCFKRK